MGSLRSNVFTNYSDGSALLAIPAYDPATSQIDRFAYADYNDVWDPLEPSRRLYGLAVVGRHLRQAGFGGHDLGGANGQVNPGFAGRFQLPYPVDEAAIWTGKQTVLDVLRRYRATYTPGPTSPLTDAGDPQDGAAQTSAPSGPAGPTRLTASPCPSGPSPGRPSTAGLALAVQVGSPLIVDRPWREISVSTERQEPRPNGSIG